MPQVKGFIYLVIYVSTNGQIYASRQHSSVMSVLTEGMVQTGYKFNAKRM